MRDFDHVFSCKLCVAFIDAASASGCGMFAVKSETLQLLTGEACERCQWVDLS